MTREDFPAYAVFVTLMHLVLFVLFLLAGAGWVAMAYLVAAALALSVGWWMQ